MTNSGVRIGATLGLGLIVLTACSTEPGGIFRSFDVNKKQESVTTGARQRAIITRDTSVVSRPGLVTPQNIVCAEPSPDVATAIATSFGAGVSVLGQGSGSISGETAEGILQLAERTAAIQMMRDHMYRACEAYANGAVTGTTYTLQMGRITETMVTLLLGETAGGAFGRSLGALGGKASAESKATLAGFPGALQDIGQSSEQLAEAELKVQSAQAALDKLPDEKKKAEDTDFQTAQGNLNRAKAERDALKELLKGKIEATSEAAGEIATVQAGGGITAKPDAAVAAVLADIQRTFIERDASQSLIEACLVELGMWNTAPGVDKLFEGPAKKLAAEKFNEHSAGGLAIVAAKAERTGLFDFCRDNLRSMGSEIQRTNAAIKLERIQLEQQSKDLLLIEARANASASFASALAQCDSIGDGATSVNCKAAVMAVQGQKAPRISDNARALEAVLVRSVGENSLPTLSFDRAVHAFDGTTALLAELNGLTLKVVPSGLAPDRQQALEKFRDLLEVRKKSLVERVTRETDETPDEIVMTGQRDGARQTLVRLEREQVDLGNRLQIEPNPLERRIAIAELDKARAEASRDTQKHETAGRRMNALITDLRLLIDEVKTFNNGQP